MIKTCDLFDEADLGLVAPLFLSSLESEVKSSLPFELVEAFLGLMLGKK